MQNEKGMSLPEFKISIIRGLPEKYTERRISPRGGKCTSVDIPQCLTNHHFPNYVPSTAGQGNAQGSVMCAHLVPSAISIQSAPYFTCQKPLRQRW
jgi:hypothetical protein